MKKLRQDLIFDYLYQQCSSDTRILSGLDAHTIALDLQLDRTNVSKDLNTLWKNAQVIKIAGRPTMFIPTSLLSEQYPGTYVPNFIPLGDSLQNYIKPSKVSLLIEETQTTAYYEEFGSMRGLFDQAIAAISYPVFGIPILISGNIGVGKFRFAKNLYQYAKENHIIPKQGNFVIINCLDYETRSLSNDLFGELSSNKTYQGIIDTTSEGLIYVDGIENLSFNNLELLVNLIDRQYYTKVGNSQRIPLQVRFVFSTTIDIFDKKIMHLSKQIPIRIHIPEIEKRDPIEKMFLFHQQFSNEAKQIQATIRIAKTLFALLCDTKLEFNISEIRSITKTIISKAYFQSYRKDLGLVDVKMASIPDQISEQEQSFNTDSKLIRHLNDILLDDYVYFDKSGNSNLLTHLKSNLHYSLDSIEYHIPQNNTLSISDIIKEIHMHYMQYRLQIHRLPFSHPFIRRINTLRILFTKYNDYPFISKSEEALFIIATILDQLEHLPIIQETSIENRNLEELVKRLQYSDISMNQQFDIKKITQYIAIVLNYLRTVEQEQEISFLVLLDARNDVSMYQRMFEEYGVKQYKITTVHLEIGMKTLVENVELQVKEMLHEKGLVVLTDVEMLSKFKTVLDIVDQTNIVVLYPLSIPLLTSIIDQVKKSATIRDLRTLTTLDYSFKENSIPSNIDHHELLKKLNANVLSKELNFLNPDKSSPILYEILCKITNELQTTFSNSILVKFIVHCSFMVERLIRKDAYDFPGIRKFYQDNVSMIQIIEQNIVLIHETFGIEIPPSELAYIALIFQNN